MLTDKQLRLAMPNISDKNVQKYLPSLQVIVPNYGINTPLRLAHFLAQIGHETLNFFYFREISDGKKYEGRKDLGNTQPGDGEKFKGRGAIQITGRANYKECSMALFNDDRLLSFPELLELPENGIKAACWFWIKNNLNKYADKDDVVGLRKKVNGGKNGLNDCIIRLAKAKKAIGI